MTLHIGSQDYTVAVPGAKKFYIGSNFIGLAKGDELNLNWYNWQTNPNISSWGVGSVRTSGWWMGFDGNDVDSAVSVSIGRYGSTASVYTTDGINWNSSTLPVQQDWRTLSYGGGTYIASSNSATGAVSTDGGQTWESTTFPYDSGYVYTCYGNGTWIATISKRPYAAYSSDGGKTWTSSTLPSGLDNYESFGKAIFDEKTGNFFVLGDDKCMYSRDNGRTWNISTTPSSFYPNGCGTDGNGFYLCTVWGQQYTSNDGGETWVGKATSDQNNWCAPAYLNGRFVAIAKGDEMRGTSVNKFKYSDDYGETWTEGELPVSGYWNKVSSKGNVFTAYQEYSDTCVYSYDGITWEQFSIPNTSNPNGIIWRGPLLINNRLICIGYTGTMFAYLPLNISSCYTKTNNPDVSTQVYDEPNVASTKTITSVGESSITLSDTKVYNRNSSGDITN